jgi:beta-RFAP synthase
LARRFLSHYKLRQGAHLAVKTTIPAHAGLGSGTQLALGVASALARLYSINANVRELATVMGRGRRSGIGITAFERGGFIVDAGRKTELSVERRASSVDKTVERGLKHTNTRTVEPVPPTIVRYPFPKEWVFVVAIPRVGHGLAGTAEVSAFHRLAGRPAAAAGRLSRILLMQMLPAVLDRDPVVFGESLTQIQRIVGAWFRPAQGGTFASPEGAALIKAMSRAGALGVGQSSWGPTVYGLAEDMGMAISIMDTMRRSTSATIQADIFTTHASNRGATISTSSL